MFCDHGFIIVIFVCKANGIKYNQVDEIGQQRSLWWQRSSDEIDPRGNGHFFVGDGLWAHLFVNSTINSLLYNIPNIEIIRRRLENWYLHEY